MKKIFIILIIGLALSLSNAYLRHTNNGRNNPNYED